MDLSRRVPLSAEFPLDSTCGPAITAPMSDFETPQEAFWAGDFGNEYIGRNRGDEPLASNLALFAKVLSHTTGVQSVLELGANIGNNLRAIKMLLPKTKLKAVEINAKAVEELRKIEGATVHHTTILDFKPETLSDLVLIKGVLIHIDPSKLPEVYDLLFSASSRYICIVEYYNPVPVSLPYRGHADRLFKRDFAGEVLKQHPGLRLVAYGFAYHGDSNFPQDDVTWFLLEKPAA